jgi:hypothetical protein
LPASVETGLEMDENKIAALLDRIDRVESRIAIEELMAGYAHSLDLKEPESFREIWHEDAEFDVGEPFGSVTGLEAIMEAANAFWKQNHWMNHWMATPSIKISGDQAVGVTGVDCMVKEMEEGPVQVAGTYFDRFARRDGVWKIESRRYTTHYFTPLNDWIPQFGSQT